MKNILLLMHDDDGQEARLQAALDVTRATAGHLICLEVIALPLIVSDFYSGGGEALLVEELRNHESRLRAKTMLRLQAEDVPWSIEEGHEQLASAFEHHAGLADLIVLSSRSVEGDADKARGHPKNLPLNARRPILAVPPESRGVDLAGRAIIAWDGSATSQEAIRAAVPLLKLARDVVVVGVNQPSGAFSMADAARYLSRHGIESELMERETHGTIAEILLDAVSDGAGFMVMGAYGAPSLAERIFGGVTRTMLMQSPVPLLLAH